MSSPQKEQAHAVPGHRDSADWTSTAIDLWYKDAIVYEVDVKTFKDSNGDGVGDFGGLIQRLSHIAGLGATCLWLQPFYPSPGRDDGYDVTDFYGIDPRLGTLGDFVEFMHQARERGIRVLADLVVNHTSDQHPWFRSARADEGSPYRDYYIWSKDEPADLTTGIVFPGVQKSVWTYDSAAQAYFHHQFYEHQPDLNIANPAVREEICKIMGFWLELGLSGFRLDAAPFLLERQRELKIDDPYAFLREFRHFLSWRRGDGVFLAEANVPPEEVREYFAPGTHMHMLFNFLANQHLFLALARKSAAPLIAALEKLPDVPFICQWATFLRNHDELDLARLTDSERAEVYAAFAPQPTMQIYGRGIRRRLASMFGGDQHRLEMAYSLMLTLPGTPVVRYGDEIGMGEDLSLDQRLSVRTPMQWSSEPNGGFSSAPPADLIRPLITGGPFGYQQVNVADQQRDSQSLINWMERAIRMRKQCPEFGRGSCDILDSGDLAIFAHRCQWLDGIVIALHNFSDRPATARIELPLAADEHLVELLGDRDYGQVEQSGTVELAPYGWRWFRVCGACRRPL